MRPFSIALVFIVLLCGCRTAPPPAPRGVAPVVPVHRSKQLFVVIDDAGLSMNETQRFLDIPVPMTMAVLPHLKDTERVCQTIARYADKEIILHQPMEAYDPQENPGQGAIRNMMRPDQVKSILEWNLSAVPGAVGMNNHMGSRITENANLMREVLRFCKANDLFFLDSKTAYNSVVPRVAAEEFVHIEQRDSFLDIEHDREYIRRMWEQAVSKAREHGYAVVIGHAWSAETAAAIRDSYETLHNQGYSFHRLSELYP